MNSDPATLAIPRHLKYWLRNLKTFLPHQYTSTDLNRLTLSHFTLCALDLLPSDPTSPTPSPSALYSSTTPLERAHYSTWIYTLQHPLGGFRGSPATHFPDSPENPWDPPNLPATFFAVVALATLGDDLSRLNVEGVRNWVGRLQREDGSFGEWVLEGGLGGGEDGVKMARVCGGRDMRYVYFAAALRALLGEGDWDVEKTVNYVVESQTYDGGIAEMPFHEAHAGMTYCAIAALKLLGRLDDPRIRKERLLGWLASRQVELMRMDEEEEEDEEEATRGMGKEEKEKRAREVEVDEKGKPKWAGFNGRCNKTPDTCYSFWVGASLDMLGRYDLIDKEANRRFLLEKTQSIVGGFKKLPYPSGFPDILHSFLGLAALTLGGESDLNGLDAALCVSLHVKERLSKLPWWKGN